METPYTPTLCLTAHVNALFDLSRHHDSNRPCPVPIERACRIEHHAAFMGVPEIKNQVSILLDTSYLDTPARGDTSRMASAGGVPAKGGLWAH